MLLTNWYSLWDDNVLIIIVTGYLDQIFDTKIIIYMKILCHLAYNTLDPICMILLFADVVLMTHHSPLSILFQSKFLSVLLVVVRSLDLLLLFLEFNSSPRPLIIILLFQSKAVCKVTSFSNSWGRVLLPNYQY